MTAAKQEANHNDSEGSEVGFDPEALREITDLGFRAIIVHHAGRLRPRKARQLAREARRPDGLLRKLLGSEKMSAYAIEVDRLYVPSSP